MLPELLNVTPIEGYQLLLEYDNGERRLLDTSFWLEKPMYNCLRSKELFDTVKVQGMTIIWDNGLDIAPEDLYEFSTPIQT